MITQQAIAASLTRAAASIAVAAAVSSGPQALAQSGDSRPEDRPVRELVLRSEVAAQPLNPARGDASPRARVLWGDLTENVPTGALIQFAEGFSSPPHIHNVTYRAVVISGRIHNDDPEAARMWMGPGSFWTQPAGEAHITAAEGGNATVFLEVLDGPYLVQPSFDAVDNGERPINIVPTNLVWLDASDVTWLDESGTPAGAGVPMMAFLWGSPQRGQRSGTFLKLPAGYGGELRSGGSSLRAVAIQGQTGVRLAGRSDVERLEPGSYFGSTGEAVHHVSCDGDEPCVLYVSAQGEYRVAPQVGR